MRSSQILSMFPLAQPEAHNEMDGKMKLLVSHPFVSEMIIVGLAGLWEELVVSLTRCLCASLKDSDAENRFD